MSLQRERPRLSIVIPVISEHLGLLPVLDDVLAWRSSMDALVVAGLEIVIVDAVGTAPSGTVLQRFGEIRLIRSRRRGGYSAALQLGIAHATGSVVALVDARMNVRSNLSPLLAKLLAGADIVLSQSGSGLGTRGGLNASPALRHDAPGTLGLCVAHRSVLLPLLPMDEAIPFRAALVEYARRQHLQLVEAALTCSDVPTSRHARWLGGLRYQAFVLSTLLRQQPGRMLTVAYGIGIAGLLLVGLGVVWLQRFRPLPLWFAAAGAITVCLLAAQSAVLSMLRRGSAFAETDRLQMSDAQVSFNLRPSSRREPKDSPHK